MNEVSIVIERLKKRLIEEDRFVDASPFKMYISY